jgi:hypothetical protein
MGNHPLAGHSGDGDKIAFAIDREPIAWEFLGTYRSFENNNRKPWDDERFIRNIKTNKPNYIGMGQWGDDAQYMLSKKPGLIRHVANMMGYHFIMTGATYTNTIQAGVETEITVTVENTGVSTMLTPCTVKLALLGKNGAPASTCTTTWNAHDLMAGTTTTLSPRAIFAEAPAGDYKLAIGLFRNETDPKPTYRMENKGMTDAGFYVIGDIKIVAE